VGPILGFTYIEIGTSNYTPLDKKSVRSIYSGCQMSLKSRTMSFCYFEILVLISSVKLRIVENGMFSCKKSYKAH